LGSVSYLMLPHVPFEPDPFFAAEHATHVSAHAVSQQTLSTQLPDAHCAALMQATPFG